MVDGDDGTYYYTLQNQRVGSQLKIVFVNHTVLNKFQAAFTCWILDDIPEVRPIFGKEKHTMISKRKCHTGPPAQILSHCKDWVQESANVIRRSTPGEQNSTTRGSKS
jgi:hypothetical protein